LIDINVTRKCKQCKEYINIEQDDFIYYKKRYYHFDCAVNEQLERKNNKLTKEKCIDKFIQLQNETKEEIDNIINREKLYKWLQFTYNAVVLPSYFYIKMDEIFSGIYKGLSKEIPPEDLLDMWKRKFNELERVNDHNKRKGKLLIGISRINYDLAILLSKYDSYLKWKEEQKLLENEKQNIINEASKPKINYELINKSIDSNQESSTNINDLLDEVF
jgi:hypothetical protein